MAKANIALYGLSGTSAIHGSNQADYEAGENLTDGQAVCFKPNDAFYDSMETYADTAAIQVVYVDSDAINKMVSLEESNYAIGANALKITSAGADNEDDVVIRTISARNLTGYSVNLLVRGSATDTNFEIRVGATAGLASNYLSYEMDALGGVTTYELLTVPLASFSETGTCALTAITQVGLWHLGSGSETIIIDRMWFSLDGTTKYRLYKADATDWDTLPAVGFVDAAYSTSGTVTSIINQNLIDGFTGLVPGADVYLDDTTAGGIVQFKDALPTLKQKLGTAVSPTTIQVDIGLVA